MYLRLDERTVDPEGWGTCRDRCERKVPEIDRMLPYLEVLVFLMYSREEVKFMWEALIL